MYFDRNFRYSDASLSKLNWSYGRENKNISLELGETADVSALKQYRKQILQQHTKKRQNLRGNTSLIKT